MAKAYIYYFIGLLSLLFQACTTGEELKENSPPSNNKIQFELYTKSSSYGLPITRAGANENALDQTPWVLVFTGSDGNATFAEAAKAEYNNGKSYVYLDKQTGPCQLLMLANPQDKFYIGSTAYDYSEDGFNAALKDPVRSLQYASEKILTEPLGNPQTTAPFVGEKLSMNALVSVSGIDVGIPIPTVELKRVAAKIVVSSTSPYFTLLGITAVVNTSKQSRLYNWNSSLTYANTNLIEYRSNASYSPDFIQAESNSTASNPLYLYESGYDDADNDTYLIIRGEYRGQASYYKMGLVANGERLDVERNYLYEFTITSVEGPGYATIEDVKKSLASNTGLNYEVLIQGNSGYEIQANNDYYLGVTNSHYELYAPQNGATEYTAFTMVTDCKTPFPDKRTVRSLTTGLEIVAPSDGLIPLSSTTPYDVKIKVANGFTEGEIEIHLGSLQKIITVRRYAPVSTGTVISNFTPDVGKYTSAYIENYPMIDSNTPNPSNWLQLSPGGEPVRNDPHRITVDNGLIDLHVNGSGEGDAYVSMSKKITEYLTAEQRIKVHITVL